MKLWKQIALAAGTAALTAGAAHAARRATLHFLGRSRPASPRLIPAVASHVTSVANRPRQRAR